jgi:hypothetical protein
MSDDRRLGYDEQEKVSSWTYSKILSLSEQIVSVTRDALRELYSESSAERQESLLAVVTGCLETLHVLCGTASPSSTHVGAVLPEHVLTLFFDVLDASILHRPDHGSDAARSTARRLSADAGLVCVETLSEIVRRPYAPTHSQNGLFLIANVAHRATHMLGAVASLAGDASDEAQERSEAVCVALLELLEGFVSTHLVRCVQQQEGHEPVALQELLALLAHAGKLTAHSLKIQAALARVWSALMDLEVTSSAFTIHFTLDMTVVCVCARIGACKQWRATVCRWCSCRGSTAAELCAVYCQRRSSDALHRAGRGGRR